MIRYLERNSAKVRAGQQVSRSGDSQDWHDRLYLYTTPSFSGIFCTCRYNIWTDFDIIGIKDFI